MKRQTWLRNLLLWLDRSPPSIRRAQKLGLREGVKTGLCFSKNPKNFRPS